MVNRFIGISNVAISCLINKWDNGELNPMVPMKEVRAFMYRLMNYTQKANEINLIVLPEEDWKHLLEIKYPEYFICFENEQDIWLMTINMSKEKWSNLKSWFKWDLPFYLIDAYDELGNYR